LHFCYVTLFPLSASAGEATDRLSVCLVSNTTRAENISLVRWIVAAYIAHPDVADLANPSRSQITKVNKDLAHIFERLLKTCKSELRTAFIVDGEYAIEASFTVLGEAAGQSLFRDRSVNAALEGFIPFMDMSIFEELLK
jgi:hypothetical protein